jgi:regulator of replication initiation timing
VLEGYQNKVKELMSKVEELTTENKVLKRRLFQQATSSSTSNHK